MEIALVGLVGVLVGHFLTAHFKSKELRSGQIKALAAFLDSIAASLMEIKTSLSKDVIPTGAGNKLKKVLKNYRDIIDSAPLDDKTKSAILFQKQEIERCLTAGQIEDDILRGKIIRSARIKKEEVLLDMERAAARLQGQADVLKVLA
jgi:hypothetical protein